MLFSELSKLLNLSLDEYHEQFVMVLDNLCFDKVATTLFKNRQEIVMSTKMYFTESSVAQKLALLCLTAKESQKDVSNEIS